MTKYEILLNEADKLNIVAKEKPLRANNGRIKGNRIAIRQNMTEPEKRCTLAEELGHYYTTTGDILDQSSISNRKQELRARVWAYNKLIGLKGIVDCYLSKRQSSEDMAEFLGVSEDFLFEALQYYKSKYGLHTQLDNYVIFFEPSLAVLELI